MNGVATEDDRGGSPVLFADVGQGLVELAFADACGHTVEEATFAVVFLAPVVHGGEHGWLLINRAFPGVKLLPCVVRDDDGGFEYAISGRVEAGHFKIEPEKTGLFAFAISHRQAGKGSRKALSMQKPETDITEAKKVLRQQMRERRQAQHSWEAQEGSRRICAKVREDRAWARAQNLAVYFPFDGEVNIRPLILAGWASHRVLAPRLEEGGRMTWHVVRGWKDLEMNPRGYEEPRLNLPQVAMTLRDLILVPGLAFDRAGHRLGFGLGCYDRFLKDCPARKVGLAYRFQVVEALPVEPHDVVLDEVITDAL